MSAPEPTPVNTESGYQESIRSVAALLAEQPRRIVRLRPEGPPEKPGDKTVQINGYTFQIMRGREVEVPDEVYQILARAGEI